MCLLLRRLNDERSRRMKNKILPCLLLTLLAIVLTVALTFVTVEGPRALDRFVARILGVPQFHPVCEHEPIEQFMRANHVRLIGYACLVGVIVLIIAGFVTERTVLSSAGAIAFFLPTFGHFALYMFFLAGLGILRALWLPFWGDLMKLGDIAYLAYMIVVYPLALVDVDIRGHVPLLLIGLGFMLFLLAELAWLYGKLQRKGTVDLWLYRLSRHPQYLGWIVWSYGLMLLASQQEPVLGGQSPGLGLPWLVSSLVIICVALAEEIKMGRERGDEYAAYRARAPFMLPLPRLVSAVIVIPMRVVLKKDRPENAKELLITFGMYLAILLLLSVPFLLLDVPAYGWWAWPRTLS